MTKLLRALKTSNAGASAAEYALIISLIGVAIIVGATALGTAINGRLTSTATTVSGAA